TCDPPERLQYAELEEKFRGIANFPVGSQVSFVCRPGYMRSPGKSATLTCGPDSQWSPREQFCVERRCQYPEQVEHGFAHFTDLTFGSEVTFSCEEGYRLIGAGKISCVIRNEGVGWSNDVPFCEIISCEPPPSITNGRYTELDNYVYQVSVRYSCLAPFSLVGPETLVCKPDEKSNGIWSNPPPECKVVKCENPTVQNGRKTSGFGPSYSYKDTVIFECDPGYAMEGSYLITCEGNNSWTPPVPTCKEVVVDVCGAPEIRNGVVVPLKSVYEKGESVLIKCNAHCSFPGGTEQMTVTCQGQRTWSSYQNCASSSPGSTPVISYGRVVKGQKPFYSVGDQITIECYTGYQLHGAAEIRYIGGNQWTPAVPTCHLSGYIIAIICVVVVAVVLLAAFWAYKKFFSQNGKPDSTPCTAEYKICKA
ncbi:C4BPA protein, partial [Pitta sordida]|nr:C4BPA protein [Pitta sordida]